MQNLTTQIIFKRLLKDNTSTQLSNEFRLSESSINRYAMGGEVGISALKKIIKSNIWTDNEMEFFNDLLEKKRIKKSEQMYNQFHRKNSLKRTTYKGKPGYWLQNNFYECISALPVETPKTFKSPSLRPLDEFMPTLATFTQAENKDVKPVAKCEPCEAINDNEKVDYSYIAGIITAIILAMVVIPLLKYFDLL